MTVQMHLPDEIDRLALVKEFQRGDPMHPSDKEFHYTLIREEMDEVAKAYMELLKELTDLEYVLVGATAKGIHEYPEDIVENLYAFEHLYKAIPTPILNEAFIRVHKSNMSKLPFEKREDGKVLKGPNYQPPDLKDLV